MDFIRGFFDITSRRAGINAFWRPFFTLALDKAEKGANSVSPLIANALRYINDSLPTLRGIGEVARHLFVSESYLFRRFKREMHQTPKQYIGGKRLLLAEQMLALGESPTAVCQAVGFGDYTSFYRNYRAFFGRAPSVRAMSAERNERNKTENARTNI